MLNKDEMQTHAEPDEASKILIDCRIPLQGSIKIATRGRSEVIIEPSSIKWKCRNCGYVFEGREAPGKCPVCDHARSYFVVWYENY